MKEMRRILFEALKEDLSPGDVLNALRIDAGFTQEELASITKISRPNINALEKGRREMTSHYALLLAAALGAHPADILFPSGYWKKTEELKRIERTASLFSKKKKSG